MSYCVRLAEPHDAERWDAYVTAHPDGTLLHGFRWKTLVERTARQVCPYLIAEKKGQVAGVLPLSLRKSLLFGRSLISTSFAVYGGPLVDDAAAASMLDDAAWRLAEDLGASALEYRSLMASHAHDPDWTLLEGQSAVFQAPIAPTADARLQAIPRKQRAVVRKALKNNLKTRLGHANWRQAYALYAISVRNLGTPVFPKALFAGIADLFPDEAEFAVIETQAGEAVASLVSFYDGDTVRPYYAGGTPSARMVAAHDGMYFSLMERAADRGCVLFDFGRSRVDSGPYRFKRNWGFAPTPLGYEIRTAPGRKAPNVTPGAGGYGFASAVWRRLPLLLTNRLGPVFARHLG
ncbi:FemAB family XrtA/PEP-CTERM system-associated protein [Eilatimonas milleporae]|uniref:FemAB-related protein (PEP-CTERM system-associated) n=1 Tax=Eilatimonas milleporae TaxID=911205 RepID=A0A3M0CH64_9PROT|nr:FemAB family XrtA/PEP-CTERM system-associated protein [Eilatimonas milleporae]RMB08918.1 FemAB-related protein (PEP-CTERM system-associated) [Eilatimonas milleporae]